MRVVYILAHHDDELGAWPLVRKYHRLGAQQTFLYLTSSGTGDTAPLRQKETMRCLSALGLPEPDCRFVGFDHGIAPRDLHSHLRRVGELLLEIVTPLAPDVIVTHALEGGHADHDAAHALTCWLTSRLPLAPEAYQFSIYNMRETRWPLFHGADPIPENGPLLKVPMSAREWMHFALSVRHHPSQWKVMAPLWPAMMWTYLRRGGFHYQRLEPGRIGERPHAGRLMYEQRRGDRATSHADVSANIAEALLK